MGAAPSKDEQVEGFKISSGWRGGSSTGGGRIYRGGGSVSIDSNTRNFFYGEDYLKDWTNTRENTVKRTISSKSPIYIPLVLNLAFLFIVGSRYLYYYKEKPTVEEFKKVFHSQKIDGSSSTGSSS